MEEELSLEDNANRDMEEEIQDIQIGEEAENLKISSL